MSCAAFAGSGHRLEFYGDDGALVLANPTTDYMRGFTLSHTRRPDGAFVTVAAEADPLDSLFPGDGRIAPVSRLASRFLDAIEQRKPPRPASPKAIACRSCSTPFAARTIRGACSTPSPGHFHERTPHSRHRRLGLHRLGAGEGAGEGRQHGARARRQFARRAAAAGRGQERHRVHRRRHPQRRRGRERGARHGRGAPPRLRQRHRVLLQRAGAGARRRRQGHDQRDRRLPRGGRAQSRARLKLRGLPDAAAGADRRNRAARRAGPDQPALFLRRRQDHQRTDGDQLRAQAVRPRADLPAAQRLRPGHGLRACGAAVRAAAEESGRAAPERQGAVRDPGRRAADAELLPCRRSRCRRHGDAREGRASRHLSHRHDGRGHDRRRGAADRGHCRPRDRIREPPGAGRRHRPPLPGHRQARQARLHAAGAARRGLRPTVEWYWANERLAPKA